MTKFDVLLTVVAGAAAMLLASPDAQAAPKWCDAQMYVHACATGHGGTTWYPPKKDCDHGTDSASGSNGGASS